MMQIVLLLDKDCIAKVNNMKILLVLIIGTGIAGGIINKGSLLKDSNCGVGEFGMLPYLDGTLENYYSGQFFYKENWYSR